jgi:hypothetical protein
MGRGGEFVCSTCKKAYYLGYNSYTSWLDHAHNIEEYKELPDKDKELLVNLNFEQCLKEHDGHDYFTHSTDWTSVEGKDLVLDDPMLGIGKPPTVLCKDYTDFKKINMDT